MLKKQHNKIQRTLTPTELNLNKNGVVETKPKKRGAPRKGENNRISRSFTITPDNLEWLKNQSETLSSHFNRKVSINDVLNSLVKAVKDNKNNPDISESN